MIISHQGYNTRTKDSDVALLKLQQPLVFNQFIRPIDIWMNPLFPFRKCTITGWGSTRESEQDSILQTSDKELQSDLLLFSASSDGPRVNRLQEVNVTILPHDVCNQYYLGRIQPSMFCAGKDRGGADACQVRHDRV